MVTSYLGLWPQGRVDKLPCGIHFDIPEGLRPRHSVLNDLPGVCAPSPVGLSIVASESPARRTLVITGQRVVSPMAGNTRFSARCHQFKAVLGFFQVAT